MYSKNEASKIKQHFWTRFGQYMKPIPGAGGEKVNWSNYKTGIAHIYFRLRVEKTFASIAIELTNPSTETRNEQYQQFLSLQTMLEQTMQTALHWEENTTDENQKNISRISLTLPDVNIFRENDWPTIISFLKTSIINLDAFWEDGKMIFE